MIPLLSSPGRPFAIGHRGAMGHAPENTMPSFERGWRMGAGLLELDVHVTADDQLAVIHDATLERTTNGTGWVKDHSAAQLRALDAGGWYAPAFAGARVPLLGEVIGPAPSDLRPGDGACFGEAASRGRGGITPPRLYGFQRQLGAFLADRGIRLRENADGYFSRSDCAPLSLATPNVALVGYLLAHRHFDGVPRAHPADLVDLARALAVYALVAQSPAWRCACLGAEEP